MIAGNILLVDDNKSIQDLYRSRLAREHYHVTVAENGLDAVKLLLAKPDQHQLVVLDLLVPLLDGYKVLQVIRSHPQLSLLPVIVFSAKSQPEEIDRALAAGATDFLNKTSIKPDDLVARVKQLLSNAQAASTAQPAEAAPHYQIQIKDTALDAPKLAKELGVSPFFTCLRCEKELLFDLTLQRRAPLEFQAQLVCPRCGPLSGQG
ncbi:MAG: response regulator [Nitrospirota bacterium]